MWFNSPSRAVNIEPRHLPMDPPPRWTRPRPRPGRSSASKASNHNQFNNYGRISKQQYNAKLYQPLGNSRAIYAGLACSPCVSASNHRKTACTDNVCMQAISVDEVFAAGSDVLAAPAIVR